jgi:hypothetical protein
MKLHPMCGHQGCVWCQGQVERAGADERAAIVAYFRRKANARYPTEAGEHRMSPAARGLLLLLADRIETGDHMKVEGE